MFNVDIHAREWISGAVTTYIINDLLNGNLQSELDSFDFYIIPITNPDGYEYTHTSVSIHGKQWPVAIQYRF